MEKQYNTIAITRQGKTRHIPTSTGPARISRIEPRDEIGPAPMPIAMSGPAQVQSVTKGTHRDRAEGFRISTAPIGWLFSLVAVLVAWLGFSVPIASLTTLAVLFASLLAWWLMAWIIHNLLSADGVAFFTVWAQYRYLRHEQKNRWSKNEYD